jgi:hypothetical protein
MSDPIAEAAANLNDAAPSSTEPTVEIVGNGVQDDTEALQAKVNAAQANGETIIGLGADSSPAQESTAEHPHTSILRRLTETLRRKWNVFDGELEAILKDAESHL